VAQEVLSALSSATLPVRTKEIKVLLKALSGKKSEGIRIRLYRNRSSVAEPEKLYGHEALTDKLTGNCAPSCNIITRQQ